MDAQSSSMSLVVIRWGDGGVCRVGSGGIADDVRVVTVRFDWDWSLKDGKLPWEMVEKG